MNKMTGWFLGIAALFAIDPIALASVHVVDAFDASNFNQIHQAVNASVDGDTILVKTGTYSGFTVDSLSVTIVAEKDADVVVSSIFPVFSMRVRNLLAHQTVVLRGFSGGALQLSNNQGGVRVEDCSLKGYVGNCSEVTSEPGSAGADVLNCASVSFNRCALVGGEGGSLSLPLFSCTSGGGVGLRATTSQVVLYDTAVTSGPSGPADPILQFSSTVYDGLSPGRHFEATSPLRKNQLGQLKLDGEPGDVVLLLIAATPAHMPVPFYQGVLLVGPITSAVVLGTLAAPDGALTLPLVITDLPPIGVDALNLHLQAAFANSATTGLLGPSTILTILDPAF